jgi:toxin ParE1/3/4
MAGKRIEIHPAALAELKSAVEWYLERSQPAAEEFVAEVDRAKARVIESPRRWPFGEYNTRRFVLQRFPFAIAYREKFGRANPGIRSRSSAARILEGTVVADENGWRDKTKSESPP